MSNQLKASVPIIQTQTPRQINDYNNKINQYQEVINIPNSFNRDLNSQKREVTKCKLILQYLITFFILSIITCDIAIEIKYKFINFYGMIDNIAIILLSIKLAKTCINKRNFYSKKLSLIIALIIIFGFCLKGFSMSYCLMEENVNLLIIYGLIIGFRTFFLVWLFPFTCRQ